MYAARAGLTVTPSDLDFNEETAPDNPFMTRNAGLSIQEIRRRAIDEFNNMVRLVSEVGIRVHVFDRQNYRDLKDKTWPDAVYPNWWLTDTNNRVWFMPMCCPSRNAEKAMARFVLESVMKEYHVSKVTNFAADSDPEKTSLEGIGALAIDRYKRRVFTTMSRRANVGLCRKWAADAGYEPVIFETTNNQNNPFYHTDLMLALGDKFAVVCAEAILPKYRDRVVSLLSEDREIIEITLEQAEDYYCGNILQMGNERGELFIIMSQRAYEGFTEQQKNTMSKYGKIIACPLTTIETIGGGSLHCVLQEIFLAPKNDKDKVNGLDADLNKLQLRDGAENGLENGLMLSRGP